jgi:hypothetical protein
MPTTAYLLTRASGATSIALCAKDLEVDYLLKMENRGTRDPVNEAREIAFAVAEVGQPAYGFAKSIPSSWYEAAQKLEANVVHEALGNFALAMVEDQYAMKPWRSEDADGRSVLLLVPDILEERDVVTCLASLGHETASLCQQQGGSFPVRELEAFGVPVSYVPETAAPAP